MAINLELSSLETGELYKALTKAQVNFTECATQGINSHFKSKYALYPDLINATRSALAEQGLCVISKILHFDGEIYTVVELHHGASQQFTRCWQKLEPLKKDTHGYSSANTYWRRTMYRDLINVNCADGDDDGNYASDGDDDGNYASTSISNNKSNSNNNKLGKKAANSVSNDQGVINNNNVAKKAADTVITSNELAELEEKLIDAPERRADFLEYFEITDLSQLKQSQYAVIISSLNRRASK